MPKPALYPRRLRVPLVEAVGLPLFRIHRGSLRSHAASIRQIPLESLCPVLEGWEYRKSSSCTTVANHTRSVHSIASGACQGLQRLGGWMVRK